MPSWVINRGREIGPVAVSWVGGWQGQPTVLPELLKVHLR